MMKPIRVACNSVLASIAIWLGSWPIEAWAPRTARRAAEICKTDACNGGGEGGGWLTGLLVLIVLLVIGAIVNWFEEREYKYTGKTGRNTSDLKASYRQAKRQGFRGGFKKYVEQYNRDDRYGLQRELPANPPTDESQRTDTFPKTFDSSVTQKTGGVSIVLTTTVIGLILIAIVIANLLPKGFDQPEYQWQPARMSADHAQGQFEIPVTGLSNEQGEEPIRYEERFPERQNTYVDLPAMVPLCTSQVDADHIYYSQRLERWDVILDLIEGGRCVIFNQVISVYTLSSTKMWASWEFDPINFIQVRVNNRPYWLHRDSVIAPLIFEES